MTPKSTRTVHMMRHDAHMGTMVLARDEAGVCGIWFEGQRHFPATAHWQESPNDPLLLRAAAQLDAYFEGQLTVFDLPLSLLAGTAFQQSVWNALLEMECGTTQSYAALAARLGRPRAVRAVAAAVGRNPLSIVVPCHRILGADGSLTGYAGGLERKAALLQLERTHG